MLHKALAPLLPDHGKMNQVGSIWPLNLLKNLQKKPLSLTSYLMHPALVAAKRFSLFLGC